MLRSAKVAAAAYIVVTSIFASTTGTSRATSPLALSGTVIATGLANVSAVQSSRYHRLILFALYHATPSVVIIDEGSNHVVAHSATGGRTLTDAVLDEAHHRVYALAQTQQGPNPTQVWGFDIVTGRKVFYADVYKDNPPPLPGAGSRNRVIISTPAIDPSSGNVYVVIYYDFENGVITYTPNGKELHSYTLKGGNIITCVDGVHKLLVTTTFDSTGAVNGIVALHSGNGHPAWSVRFAYTPRDISCDQRDNEAIILQPSGGVALLNIITHRFAPHIGGAPASMVWYQWNLYLDEATHTELVMAKQVTQGVTGDLIVFDLQRHVRHTLQTRLNPNFPVSYGMPITQTGARFIASDNRHNLVWILYADKDRVHTDTATIDMASERVVSIRTMGASDIKIDQVVGGTSTSIYMIQNHSYTDPNTGVSVTQQALVLYPLH